jgi:hypothetical protein
MLVMSAVIGRTGNVGRNSVHFRMSSRAVVVIAAVILTTGTVIAADPSPEPLSTASPRGELASPQPSPNSSVEPSQAPSPEPAASPEPTASVEPSTAPAPSVEPEASELPEPAEPEGAPPTDAEAADFVDRLKTAGISATPAAFKELAAKVGVGGAIRAFAFAQASGRTPAQIVALREGGMGWGRMVRELNLDIKPGIGWIMSGGRGQN